MCSRGIKAVEVIDSIFSTEGAEDLYDIVNSAMSGFRSCEETNFVYSNKEGMIPLDYIQSYIVDKFAQNQNTFFSMSDERV